MSRGSTADRMALLAHQIKTPLTTVTSLSQGLMRRADRMSVEDIRVRAEKIWRAGQRVDELIQMIMSHTRFNAGAIVLTMKAFDLDDLVRKICSEHGGQEPVREFSCDLDNLPTNYMGDPVLIEQALSIVVSNAIKYSPVEGLVQVRGQRSSGEITIAVEDHGIGIPEHDLPHLMQPFRRGQNAKNIPGIGLGLSLANQILKLHGGSLQVESREGHGTTVTLHLPEEGSPVIIE